MFIGHPLDWYRRTTDAWAEIVPNFYVTNNFQQLIAMARLGEVNRVMIALGVENFSEEKYWSEMDNKWHSSGATAQKATEIFHEEFPEIPVLAVGRMEVVTDDYLYLYKPISNENEYYYSYKDNNIDLDVLVTKFFKGDSIIDLPCISYKGVEREKHSLDKT